MAWRKWFAALLSSTLSACAAGEGRVGDGTDLLGLYSAAYATGAFGFSCYPSLYVGGPAHPRYDRMRRELRERRVRIKEHLETSFGLGQIEEIERQLDEQEHGVYRIGCDFRETERARFRYRRLLRELELRTGLRS